MHDHSDEMLRCLAECDVAGVRRLWHHIAPTAPAPKTEREALLALHYARTVCRRLPLRARAWSHHWLVEQGLPSGLPDGLRDKADRLYPRIIGAFGVAVRSSYPEVAALIRDAMLDGARECVAEGHEEPEYVVPVMLERRSLAKRKLHGLLSEAAAHELRRRTLGKPNG